MSRILDDFINEISKHSGMELSKKSGVNANTIYAWRNRKSVPSLEAAQIVANAIGMEFLLFNKE